jgi:uncharacterized membrane protein
MLEIENQQTGEYETQITIKPNNSSTPFQTAALRVIGSIWFFMVSLSCILMGAWPVIIYALLTILAISFAFKCCDKKANDYERLLLNDHQLILEKEVSGAYEQYQFIPHWLKVNANYDRNGDCKHLFLKMHAKSFEFANHLTYEDRQKLLNFLRPRIGSAFVA